MRERFERELKVLAEEILKMGLMVERALGEAMNALKSADTDAADSIVAADRDIDEMEARIEGLCAMIIAREQPVAGDLRDVLTAQKISSELERMGDHARSLAKRTGKLGIGELAIAMPFFDS
ncbi:MAG: PhoU domain-containing protein, partial [Spirochaetaceae bacterium]|nr:PhoU domain-containing protein [Spirochaetaceae bacterium]